MSIILNILFLLVGFVLLVKGADYFVEGSAAVAKKLKVPGVIIGLTIVAMGTSAPELAVSTSAGIAGSNALAISNVIGSNIFNLAVVLGVCALMSPVVVDKGIMKRDFPISIFVAVLLAFFAGDMFLMGNRSQTTNGILMTGSINRWKGIVLIALFIIYIIMTVISALKNRLEGEEIEELSNAKCAIFIIGGIIAIIFGGQLVVTHAKAIAAFFGMSETLIGLTIVAIGTSLPELVTSIVASSKGQNGMAIGNVVGSNIFNILLILGVSSSINPIPVGFESLIDLCVLIVLSLLVFIFCKSGKKLGRLEGGLMVAAYVAYTVYAIIR